MMLNRHFSVVTLAVLLLFAPQLKAQKTNELIATTLTLSGTPETYSFEKIIEATGTQKKVLYERTKNWIKANLKTNKDNIYFDDESFNTINATIALPIKDFSIDVTRQYVEFKINISFKDDKLKCNANSFMYYGLDGMGVVWQKSLENLKPLRKKVQKHIYEDFDTQFSAMIKAMEKASTNATEKDW